jgi:hypothetical protein
LKIGLSAFVGIAAILVATAAHAQVLSWMTPAGASIAGNAVNARADFLEANGTLTITLTDLQKNPRSDTQLISGISFNLSGLNGSGAVVTLNKGNISTIQSNGSYAAGTSDSLSRWQANKSGSNINLNIFSGGQPNRQIIGPDSQGGFTGAGSYGNPSVFNHEPVVLGSASFVLTIPGITTPSTIGGVSFQFGTDPMSNFLSATVAPNSVASPEPGGMALFAGVAVTGTAVAFARRRRK